MTAAAGRSGSSMQAADWSHSTLHNITTSPCTGAELVQCVSPAGGDGLVQLYSVFEEETHKHLIMEFCKGGDLFKLLLLRGGTLEEHWVCMEVGGPRHAAFCVLQGPTTAAQHTAVGSAWSAAFHTTTAQSPAQGCFCAAWMDAGIQPPACSI